MKKYKLPLIILIDIIIINLILDLISMPSDISVLFGIFLIIVLIVANIEIIKYSLKTIK